jgi:hypothetical protein
LFSFRGGDKSFQLKMKNSLSLSERESRRRGIFPIFMAFLMIATLQIIGCATPSQKPAPQAMTTNESPTTPEEHGRIEERGVEEGAGARTVEEPAGAEDRAQVEERWGVKILGIRQTANAFLLDFRFRVTDPEKAAPLTDRKAKPYLIDEASGVKLEVPNAPKVGSLRARGNPEPSRTYFILFGNSRGLVKKGNKVTVVIGDFEVENLIVE